MTLYKQPDIDKIMNQIEIKSLARLDEAASEILRELGDTRKVAFAGEMGTGCLTGHELLPT